MVTVSKNVASSLYGQAVSVPRGVQSPNWPFEAITSNYWPLHTRVPIDATGCTSLRRGAITSFGRDEYDWQVSRRCRLVGRKGIRRLLSRRESDLHWRESKDEADRASCLGDLWVGEDSAGARPAWTNRWTETMDVPRVSIKRRRHNERLTCHVGIYKRDFFTGTTQSRISSDVSWDITTCPYILYLYVCLYIIVYLYIRNIYIYMVHFIV